MNERHLHDEVAALLPAREGHFGLESGHHADMWLDLELLCLRPQRVQALAAELATRLAAHHVEAVCGPLVEGAFVALLVATRLGVPFTYTEKVVDLAVDALFPLRYRIPRGLRAELHGKRVAIVDDVINAGSAVLGTCEALTACEAKPVAIGALAVLGHAAARFAADRQLTLDALATLPSDLWTPADCPLCTRGIPLTAGGG